jgi:hypothetical protein
MVSQLRRDNDEDRIACYCDAIFFLTLRRD